MTTPFSDSSFVDELHELMAVAILSAQRDVDTDASAIFEAWGLSYPDDALGPVGRGLALIKQGKTKEGYALVKQAAETANTRRDQAQDVMKSLQDDLEEVNA